MSSLRYRTAACAVLAALTLAACSDPSSVTDSANDATTTTTDSTDSTDSAGTGKATAFRLTGIAPLTRDGDTYVVPDVEPGAAPGTVVAAEERPTTDRIGDAARVRFLYTSEDRDGRPNVVSGQLLLPRGTPPAGGWPVVSWGHGTTGVADRCAPSGTDNLFYNEYAQEAATHLAAGYAVVASDYPGLGTPGPHSYLVGVDEGNAIVDAVTAARSLSDSLADMWFAVGHSQGGQGVLFATRSAERAPDLRLAGAVSMAPAAGLQAALPAVVAGGLPTDVAYGVYLLEGLSTVDPDVDVMELLGPEGTPRAALFLTDGCLLDALDAILGDGVDVPAVFDLTLERSAELSARVGEYGNPDREATVGPVLVVQGIDDHDVPAGVTEQMVRNLEQLGSDVEYRTYDGLGHDQVLGASICDRLSWMTARGGPDVPDCVAYETDMS